jgi:hypothetical protein
MSPDKLRVSGACRNKYEITRTYGSCTWDSCMIPDRPSLRGKNRFVYEKKKG